MLLAAAVLGATGALVAHLQRSPASARVIVQAGVVVPLAWPDRRMVADRLRVALRFEPPPASYAVDHVAPYPRDPVRRR